MPQLFPALGAGKSWEKVGGRLDPPVGTACQPGATNLEVLTDFIFIFKFGIEIVGLCKKIHHNICPERPYYNPQKDI